MPTTAIHSNLTLQIDSIFFWLCVFCTFFLQRSTPALDGTVLGLPKSHIIPIPAYTAIPLPLHTATYTTLNAELQSTQNASHSWRLGGIATVFKLQNSVQNTLNHPRCTDFFSSDSIYTNSVFLFRWSKIFKISMYPNFSSHEQLQQILPLLIQTQVKSKGADVFTDNREAIMRSRQRKLRICKRLHLFFLVCNNLRRAKKISI